MSDISDDDIKFLSSSSVKFNGEDLCERANINRRNGYKPTPQPIQEINEQFIDMKLKQKSESFGSDFEINSMIESVVNLKEDGYLSHSSDDSSDSIEELLEESEMAANWNSNVFKKPNEEEFVESIDYSSIFESMLSCLSFNSVSVDPYESVQKAFSFNKSFLSRLKRLNCKDIRLELHLWPSIVKNVSITCISSPKSGKTNSYLVPLMNWFDSRETQDNKEDIKIGAVVICSSTRQTYEIARQAKQWRDPDIPQMEQTIRIVSMNSTNETKQLTAILNGCDILITTPKPLLRAIQSSIIDFSNTKSLIIDEADITLALHLDTIREIYVSYANMKKSIKRVVQKNGNVLNPMAFQTMVFAQKWTQDVEWFTREIQWKPNILFGSYYEMSIALKVWCTVVVMDSEDTREEMVKLLLRKALKENKKQIAIVCRNEDEICFLRRHLKGEIDCNGQLESLVVTHKTPHFELERKRQKWNNRSGLLFITDNAIKITGGFHSSQCIIHYKLPNDFDNSFGDRLRLMKKHFKRSKFPFEHLTHLMNFFVVSPTDSDIPQLITYLRRLSIPIPQNLSSLCNYERRSLCSYFSSFGKCPIGSIYCSHRHKLTEFDKPLPGLPRNGQIKIVLTYVMGANQFYFRLQEFRNESQISGKWHKTDLIYDDIRQELNSLKDMPFNTVKRISSEEVYGIAVRGEVLRVRLVRLLGEEELQFYEEYDPNDKSQKIELFCLDFGHKLRSHLRQLFKLPERLKHLPPFAFKAYLFGIKPIDNEIEWDFRSTQKFYNLVDNFRITQITAWILKQINGVFWLNRISVEKGLNNAKLKVESNPIKYLIESKYVKQNENKLKDFNTDYNRIVNIWQNSRLNDTVYNSCLVDNSSYVFVSDFVSLNHFYLILEDRVNRLEKLEDKWLKSLPSLKQLQEVTTDQICFYKGEDIEYDEIYLNRAKVVAIHDNGLVDVFLGDHGETVTKVDKNKLFQISNSDLRELPFQAIKVSLFGVREVKPISYDLICSLTRNKDNYYLLSIADKISSKDGVHTIRLFVRESDTKFVSLSKLLVDLNYAEYMDKEEDNEMVMALEKQTDDSNEEVDEYIDNLEVYMNGEMFNDLMKPFGCDKETLKKHFESQSDNESRASKTLRRLKAISAKTNGQQKKDESGDDSDEEKRPIVQSIAYDHKDFDYEIDANAPIACYDLDDHLDENCEFSDEEGFLEEEDLT